MKVAQCNLDRDQISVLQHAIDNMICSIRMHASILSSEPRFHETAREILTASHHIEASVRSLVSLASVLRQGEQSGATEDTRS
jgi:hypothetical protein